MDPLRTNRELVRTIFGQLGHLLEYEYARPALAAELGFPRVYHSPVECHGTLALDITVDRDTGDLVCLEVNGANFQGSVAVDGLPDRRCRNEVGQALRYAQGRGLVAPDGRVLTPSAVLYAHQPWPTFKTGPEHYERVTVFQHLLQASLADAVVGTRPAGDPPGPEPILLATGELGQLARHVVVERGRLTYFGRPVIFASYPFLIPELVRQGRLERGLLERASLAGVVDVEVFHGGRLTPLAWLKGVQQDLLANTGIRPIPYFEAPDARSAVERTESSLKAGPVVLKPNATSGGVAVEAVVPGTSPAAIAGVLAGMLRACQQKHGPAADKTFFPVRGFQFIDCAGFHMPDGDHAWDIRVEALLWPGRVEVAPLTVRLAPKAFDPATFNADPDRSGWVNNVSGRSTDFVRSIYDPETREALAMGLKDLDRICDATHMFTLRAVDWANKGGLGTVFEDRCDTLGTWDYGRTYRRAA